MPEPREMKVRYSAKKSLWMTLGVIAFLALCSFLNFSLFDSLENQLIDFRFNVRGEHIPAAPIRIIAIDEKSLSEVGRYPWPRAVQADLARKLKDYGVKYTFYDVMFSEVEKDPSKAMLDQLGKTVGKNAAQNSHAKESTERILREIRKLQGAETGDDQLARAIQETGNVFLPGAPFITVEGNEAESEEGTTPDPAELNCSFATLVPDGFFEFEQASSLLVTLPKFRKGMLDSGHIRYRPMPDGIYRSYPLVIQYKDAFIPHISVQMARYVLGVQKQPLKVFGNEYALLGDRKIPLEIGGYSSINFCGTKGSVFPWISVADVLSGKADPKLLKGSIAMIGATADGLSDIRATPFTKASPGVEVNANILENIVDNNFVRQAFPPIKYLFILILALGMWFLVPRVSPVAAIGYFAGILVAYVAAACAFFAFDNLEINMIFPISALSLTYFILTAYKFRTEVKHSRYMKQMFQTMVAPSVVDEILKLPSGIELGGEEKELTVMFSDIRGFTTYSESHTPHEVVGILNEYLTQMTYLIFQTEGTLDKYIGDAIMAFWGAPKHQPDNAFRACATALQMVDLLKNILHKKWEMEGREKLHIGVGLNTGKMVVGFVGSEAIKNYTLIGDAVNLGSRLEGTTKQYKVEIIIGEDTYARVKDDMLCRELDLIQVKGKQKPIRIYELLAYMAKAPENLKLKVKTFEEALAEYRAKRFEEAARKFKTCLDLDPKDGPSQVFLDRCAVLKAAPPPGDWDGVFVMKTK